MKSLVRRVLERAEAEGGNEWLQRCLAEEDTSLGTVAAEQQSTRSIMEPLEESRPSASTSAQRSPARSIQRSLPSERTVIDTAAVSEERFISTAEQEDSIHGAHRVNRRGKRNRRVLFPSPIRNSGGRGRICRSSIPLRETRLTDELSPPSLADAPPASPHGMALPTAPRSPSYAGNHPRQIPQIINSASLASRPSRLDAVRAPVSLSSYAGPDISQVSTQDVHIPVRCSHPKYNHAGESAQNDLINQLLVSLNKFNENILIIQHLYPHLYLLLQLMFGQVTL